ncbi:hypothetical protein GQ44DRAFT_134301 [Phaeosphaeriaceae sp. PMI808]|nr:hypothetical protein GQ44DRAFT_134301 [Phaeosphaeriaceae sp. PMI808]
MALLPEAKALPLSPETQLLASCYRDYPRIFPQLRRVQLEMGFLDTMHFFQVTVGNFKAYLRPDHISFTIFEKLPHLKEFAVRLLGEPRRGWRD